MPQLDGLLETSLYVDDLELSAHFYQTILGFEVIDANERLYALAVPGSQILLLFKKGASANLAMGAHDGDGELHLAFAVPEAELVVWEAWLQEHAVIIEHRRAWERGGHSLYFRDPDQHLIELATPGVWSIY
jgi:catechol 2,3-dioxygenase-like lactoylglutathione lyase family enzyme